MSWFACHRSPELFALIEDDPKGFCLLTLIAARARFQEDPCPVSGLRYGQAFIGDYKKAGIASRQAYRNSIRRLTDRGFVTIQGTNKGTIATLLPQAVYSLSAPANEPAQEPTKNHQRTNQEPLTNKGTKEQGNNEEPPATILPSNWKKLTGAERKRKKVNFNNPLMVRIGKFFGQRETTLWTIEEYAALQDVDPSEEDVVLIEEHYSYVIERNGYRFTTISTLLNNWSAARAKANAYFDENPALRAS